ncbi:hypothetical protein EDE15_4988 [Edaphobacter aggregans]|uniref:Uncharacterized protein n=1 Tax=Edaphobacter aggregans TaxID=570835 RepID=A0A428MR14_9BACT|nr:hypothetical protein EDE15_4988 [Edaphobacter aggregans]
MVPPTARLVRTDTQRNSSWPGARGSIKRPNTLPQTCLSTKLTLAVKRRTIHYRTNKFTVSNIENSFTDKLLSKEPQNDRNEVQPQGLHLAAV